MKTVFLVRHAKSSWEDISLRDIERPLNRRGLRDAPFMADLLKGKGIQPDQIISSPAVRAYTTATYFAKAFEIPIKAIVKREAIYEAYTRDVVTLIQELSDDLNTVLLFGHNPAFTSLANLFSKEEYIPNIPTCGISKIESNTTTWSNFSEQTAHLTAFYYPKQYFK